MPSRHFENLSARRTLSPTKHLGTSMECPELSAEGHVGCNQ